MKNLENFEVQELSIKEIYETKGGFWPLIAIGCAIYMACNREKYP